jgi:hypothetical protein
MNILKELDAQNFTHLPALLPPIPGSLVSEAAPKLAYSV